MARLEHVENHSHYRFKNCCYQSNSLSYICINVYMLSTLCKEPSPQTNHYPRFLNTLYFQINCWLYCICSWIVYRSLIYLYWIFFHLASKLNARQAKLYQRSQCKKSESLESMLNLLLKKQNIVKKDVLKSLPQTLLSEPAATGETVR